MLSLVVILSHYSRRTPPSLFPRSHSHFGSHPSLLPEEIPAFFSCTYEMQIPQTLCFDIHTKCPGVYPPSKRKIMNTAMQDPSTTVHPEPVKVVSSNDSNRCQYRYSNGKRCRLSGSKPHFGLCSHHFSLSNPGASPQSFSDSEDLSADLLPELSEFESAVDINQFLARLLVLVTKGRISPRRASVLAYITNQLLHSHRAIAHERGAQDDQPQKIIIDMPRPDRDDHADIPCPDDSPRPARERVPMAWVVPGANLDREKIPL